MAQELLIEIGCEDLPARYVRPLSLALGKGIVDGLRQRRIDCAYTLKHPVALPAPVFKQSVHARELVFQLSGNMAAFGGIRVFATPRRVAVWLDAVEDKQADEDLQRIGPQVAAAFKDGQPTPAALGFARSCGVDVKALKQVGGYVVFRKRQKGRNTAALIPEIFDEALKSMDALVPKRMRWGDDDETFVRPVLWLVALFGGKLIPIRRFGLKAGRKTRGHRFHAPQAITLQSPLDYESALKQAKVWADFASRRDVIRRDVELKAQELGGTARITEELLDEVTALVEWPVVIVGRIEPRFLQLPPEVIVATVETNQRYFTVFSDTPSVDGQMKSADGYLQPAFITIANIESKDVAQIVAGNERVVRPRLADALFFWNQDRKQALTDYAAKLAGMSYQKVLGSMAERVERLRTLTRRIAEQLGEDSAIAERAAALCKCDLVTHMVGEFPELQGIIGGYYARADGEPEMVAQAISQHYLPSQQGTPIPAARAGQVLALADKLDALAGIFAIGQKPTASKDPFALRRATLGVLRICIEGDLDLDLREMLAFALEQQPAGKRDQDTLAALWSFVLERLRGHVLEQGYTAEQFEAVQASTVTRPLDFQRRLDALRAFAGSTAAASLAAADKRARNILRQAKVGVGELVATRLEHPAEKALASAIDATEIALQPLRRKARYDAMLERLADLKQPVDDFFDGVRVMDEDPVLRNNRLALLARLDALCREVADLSCLPGQ